MRIPPDSGCLRVFSADVWSGISGASRRGARARAFTSGSLGRVRRVSACVLVCVRRLVRRDFAHASGPHE